MNGSAAGAAPFGGRLDWRPLALLALLVLGFVYLPVGTPRFDNAVLEALLLARSYAREHGCPNCRRLAAGAEEAARRLGLDYEIEKVEEIERILGFGVLRTPALAVDGVLELSGRVPLVEEIERILRDCAA